MSKDYLGDRMKEYERVTSYTLPKRLPVIIRLDGKAFHTYTKGFDKPFDKEIVEAMQETMLFLCQELGDVRLGYCQSDEITLVLTNDVSFEHEAFYNNKLQKLCSISASVATAKFNQLMFDRKKKFAYFDSRVFVVPNLTESMNNLYWRQADATRNSKAMVAQSLFKQSELQGLSAEQMIEKCLTEKQVDYYSYPTDYRKGSCCVKTDMGWKVDKNIPTFKDDWEYLLDKLDKKENV